jgi:hypothetical protein
VNERTDLALTSTVAVAADVLSSDVGAEQVMLDLRDGMYYGLDSVGSDIWKLVQTPVRVADICRAIAETYDVEPERCRRDVFQLLAALIERRLVEILPSK